MEVQVNATASPMCATYAQQFCCVFHWNCYFVANRANNVADT